VFKELRFHRIAALIVLVLAAAWIVTGEFASVGSHEAHAEGTKTDEGAAKTDAAEATPAEGAPAAETALRTVSGQMPETFEHSRKIKLSGATQPDKRAVLAARSDGIVNSLGLKKGETVAAGAVVMTLEGPETVARARVAEIQLAKAERDLEVAERLFKGGNTPETQVTNARSARDAAEAGFNQAKAEVDKLTLAAPFGGLVDTVEIEMGEWVRSGTPVATILSLDPILVRVEISEIDLGNIAPGAKAKVRLVNGSEMEGTVRFVAREASAQTRTFPVEIALPNPGNLMPSGMTAEVELFAASTAAVKIPRSVITLSDNGDLGVRVVDDKNIARFAPITIIDDTEEGLVVTGVPANVRVIVAGQDLVRDGDEVIVVDAPKATP
jgi:multidrug efflux system membrane fusion protein